ncbi:P-loop containing nucleoside triphosphate hydrolase protein [Parasitella parasitica]|nr:P-loop containing nucleoside triphosphate hydrolase protein [Parasitella parasitica]
MSALGAINYYPKTRIDLSRETETHTFTFDDTFDGSSSSAQIYARTAQPLVEYVFNGGKATCFAHGQTGSGKTYTMLDPVHGLYVLAAQDIFRLLSSEHYAHLSASVGFYEIYQGQLFDLLNQKNKLTAREDGNGNVVIAGLREYPINNVEDLMSVFEYGNQGRTTGKTGANNKSSRSHAVLQILLKSEVAPAKVHDQNKIHTPFRGSKLTQVLKDSFTGDSRTCMIATISPNNPNSEHTLNTLRYADRVKELRGESDSRLIGDAGENIDSAEAGLVTLEAELETRDTDTQSVANSDAIWENDVSENLLDVDFPSNEVAANALATPTNDRYFHATDKSHRQEKYLQRLESPPAEIFDHIMEDPFFSAPLTKNGSTKKLIEADTAPPDPPLSSKTISPLDETRIHRFIRLHRAQIKEMEEWIRNEKKMIGRLSLTVTSESDLLGGLNEDIMDNQQIKDDYENYLNDLDDVMDRKFELVAAVKDKIREELEE